MLKRMLDFEFGNLTFWQGFMLVIGVSVGLVFIEILIEVGINTMFGVDVEEEDNHDEIQEKGKEEYP